MPQKSERSGIKQKKEKKKKETATRNKISPERIKNNLTTKWDLTINAMIKFKNIKKRAPVNIVNSD